MSKGPLSIPASALIFSDLTFRGFWQSRWYEQKSKAEREALMKTLVDMKVRLYLTALYQGGRYSRFILAARARTRDIEHTGERQ
jgi:hypothetical protein